MPKQPSAPIRQPRPAAKLLRLIPNRDWLFALLLAAATLIAYHPAWNGGPIWDDDAHITKPELRSLHGLVRIWTEPGAAQQYYPLAHSAFWIEHRLWGDAPLGYHLVNILLHIASALILFRILRELKLPGAWAAAALFALHPIQVESVAWISELKNTLSGVFFFGSLLAYLQHDRTRKRSRYVVSIILFLCGLLAKTAIAPMPAALLALLWWRHGSAMPWKRHLLSLAPFVVIGLLFGLFTAWMERHFIIAGGLASFDLSPLDRCLIAGRALWFYLGKVFLPVNLVFIYPRWAVSAAAGQGYIAPVAALLLFAGAWLVKHWSRAPLAALLWFAIMLSPALGFVDIYPFTFSFVADHFQYLAGAGIMVLVASGAAAAIRNSRLSMPAAGAVALLCGILTWNQSGMYADAETLYRATIRKNPDCFMAYNNLGGLLLMRAGDGRCPEEAADCFRKAVQIKPDYVDARINLGNVLLESGRPYEAIREYCVALEADPKISEAHFNFGLALLQTGRTAEAIPELRMALELRPENVGARVTLGRALMMVGKPHEAIIELVEALKLSPDNPELLCMVGTACVLDRHPAAAIPVLQRAIAVNPSNADSRKELAAAYFLTGQVDAAIASAGQAQALLRAAGQETEAAAVGQDIERMRGKGASSR